MSVGMVGGSAQSQTGAGEQLREFLSFRLGAEEYGIEILKVQEIRGYDAVTHIANAPAKTGTPSAFWPPFPGVTPATIWVP